MTLLDLKTAVASLFEKTVSDFTVNGQDLFLIAINAVRREAELLHDFEFSRRLVSLTVNGVTGGSLGDAVIYGTSTQVLMKTVVDIGVFDDYANLRPVHWTTVSEGLEQARSEQRFGSVSRYPTDQELRSGPVGMKRFTVSGNTVYHYGKDSTTNFPIGLEVYTFSADWTAADLAPTAAVTGTLLPDLTGTYELVGSYLGFPLYYKDGDEFFLFNTGTHWILTEAAFPTTGTDYFRLASTSLSPEGTYTLQGSATGTPTVALTGSYTDDWLTYGTQYLIWASVVFLNYRYKHFVYRQEGNLAAPEKQRDAGLAAFIEWDAAKFETNRRHGRV